MMDKNLICIGFHKGDADFEISGGIIDIDYEQMNQLRAMIIVAIGTSEEMWRNEMSRKNPGVTDNEQIKITD